VWTGTNSERPRRAGFIALLFALMALTASSYAQSPEEQARALFQEGRTLMEENRHEEACQKFTDSLAVYASIGAQLNLGRCFEVTGRFASAFAAYKRAASMARRAGDGERADAAEGLATGIRDQLSVIVIEANARAADLEVTLDGTRVAPGAFSTPLPVDPGSHRVVAKSPGHSPWSKALMVRGKGEKYTVRVPQLQEAGAGAPAPPPPVEEDTSPSEGPDPLLVGGLVLAPLGTAGVIVGAVFGGLALKDRNQALEDPTLCPNKECTPEGREVIKRSESRGIVSTVGIVVGAVALAGGVTMIIISSLDDGDQASAELRIGPTSASIHVTF
jgi:hypothetical protein